MYRSKSARCIYIQNADDSTIVNESGVGDDDGAGDKDNDGDPSSK